MTGDGSSGRLPIINLNEDERLLKRATMEVELSCTEQTNRFFNDELQKCHGCEITKDALL